MADGTQVVVGTGDTIWTEDTGDARGKIQRTKLVLGALDTDGGDVSGTNLLPVVLGSGANTIGSVMLIDPAAVTGKITAADAGSTTVTNASGQSITTGSPTANSAVSATISGHTSYTVMLSGTYNMTTVFERSMDGGTTWVPVSLELVSLGTTITSLTEFDNRPTILRGAAGALTQIRVRCTVKTSGTCNVAIQRSYGVSNVPVGQFGGPWTVSPTAASTGGATPYHLVSAATTNATSLKGSAGIVYGIEVFNNNASARYLKLFDKASTPTLGTDTPVKTIMVPGSSNSLGAGVVRSYPVGIQFSSGVAFAITGAMADNDTTAITAGDLVLDVDYK